MYIGSTLQYIIDEDWEKKKIKELTSLNAKCILISKTYFCSVLASHFTRQVNARSSENTYAMLYRVFNIDDIISLIESLGYQLLFNHKVPPRHKFDNMLELEIDYSLHDLLFVKKGDYMLGFCGKYKDPTDIHKSALKIDKICIHMKDLIPMYTSEFSFRVDDYIKDKGFSHYNFSDARRTRI